MITARFSVNHSRPGGWNIRFGSGISLSLSQCPLSYIRLYTVYNFNYKLTTLGVQNLEINLKKKLHGLSPRANYTDRATAASRRSVANLWG
jgi:hypothetical protein